MVKKNPLGWLLKDSVVSLGLAKCWGDARRCFLHEAAGEGDAYSAASREVPDVEVDSIYAALHHAGMCLVVMGAVVLRTVAQDDQCPAEGPGGVHLTGF